MSLHLEHRLGTKIEIFDFKDGHCTINEFNTNLTIGDAIKLVRSANVKQLNEREWVLRIK
jgi:hypothetical protein